MKFGNVSEGFFYHIYIIFVVFLNLFFSGLHTGKEYFCPFIIEFLLSGEGEHLLVNKVASSTYFL